MSLLIQPCIAWVQKKLPWSNSRQAWQERLAAVLVLGCAGVLWRYGTGWSLPSQVALWGLFLVAVAVLVRFGRLKLLGPVLYYDLLRTGRRRRHIVLRSVYASAVVYILVFGYLAQLADQGLSAEELRGFFSNRAFPPRLMADLSATFFCWFTGLQFLAVFLLTPPYTAGAIAAEKERQSLDALLTTDLRNREIVLSLLVSRLANLGLVLITGLPILSLLEFLGGLDPNLVLAGFAATGLTTIGLGSLGILNSVLAAKPRTAIMRTYFLALLYLAVSSASWLLLLPELNLANYPSTADWDSPFTVQDDVEWLNVGNPGAVAWKLAGDVKAGTPLDQVLPTALRRYSWFHAVLAVVCTCLAVARLRACALPQGLGPARAKTGPGRKRTPRPSRPRPWQGWLLRWPILWKELTVDTGLRYGWLGRLGIGLLVTVIFFPAVHLTFWFGGLDASGQWWLGLGEVINLWVRVMGGLVGSFMLVQVGVKAAGSVSGERARQTLDGLLATPLGSRSIFLGKLLGSMFGPRWSWTLLGVIWLIGLLTGALHPLAAPCFLAAWLVYAAFLAAAGLYFSVVCRNTQRATLWTLVAAVVTVGASCLLAMDLTPERAEGLSVVPPVALGYLNFFAGDFKERAEVGQLFAALILLGLVLWLSMGVGLCMLGLLRFRQVIGRPTRRRGALGTGQASPMLPAETTQGPENISTLAPAKQPEPTTPLPVPELLVPNPIAKKTTSRLRARFDAEEEACPTDDHSRRRRVVSALFAVLPLSLVVSWYVIDGLAGQKRLREAIAEADRLDPGWRLEELEAKRAVVPDEQNAATVVLATEKSLHNGIQWPFREFDEIWERMIPPLSPVQQLSEAQIRALKLGMARVSQSLAKADKLADLPRGRFPVEWSPDGYSTRLDALQSARTVSRMLSNEVLLRAQEGDADGALRSCRALVNTQRAFGDEPTLMSTLVRMALRGLAVARIERALAQGEPSEAALHRLQMLIDEDAREALCLQGARGERALIDRMIGAIQSGKAPVDVVFGGEKVVSPGELEIFVSESLPGQRASILRYFNRAVEIAKLPTEKQRVQFAKLSATMNLQSPLLRLLAADMTRPAGDLHSLAQLRCVLVMLAVERYRLAHKCWPDSLGDLIPVFLDQVPTDPFNGLPLRYRRLTDGVVIYSVGPDLKDNGGTLDRKRRGVFGTDVGVQLWDVSERRQLAPTAPAAGSNPGARPPGKRQ